MPSGGLSDTLAQIAVKRVLKKTLLDKAEAAPRFLLNVPDDFPLTAFFRNNAPLAYRSAIALQQATATSIEAKTLAQQWIEILARPANVTVNDWPAIAHHLNIDRDDEGWITITLADVGISIWLQDLNNRSFLLGLRQDEPEMTLPLDRLSRRPLCLQLKLSLPMLLQFSYAGCCHWLRQAEQSAQSPFEQKTLLHQSVLHGEQGLAWRWSSQSPAACYTMLRAIVQALDTMADQQGDPVTCLRQGYALAAAVYTFQAAIPVATVPTLPPEAQISIWSIVRAAQQGLALVILGVLKQMPASNF